MAQNADVKKRKSLDERLAEIDVLPEEVDGDERKRLGKLVMVINGKLDRLDDAVGIINANHISMNGISTDDRLPSRKTLYNDALAKQIIKAASDEEAAMFRIFLPAQGGCVEGRERVSSAKMQDMQERYDKMLSNMVDIEILSKELDDKERQLEMNRRQILNLSSEKVRLNAEIDRLKKELGSNSRSKTLDFETAKNNKQ